VAVRIGDLDRDVVVSRDASRAEPSKIWLKPGWTLRAEDLLYAVLLNSANDASIALAEGMAGSVDDFARLMTSTAHELGAVRSNFVNPNGLPNEQHYSTARDLATIMRQALQRPILRQVLLTPSTVIRPLGSRRRIALRSHNRFLSRRDMQVIGKTGWTRSAKRCFVGAAALDGREVLVSVLGSVDLWGDLDRLIAFGLAHPSDSPSWPSGTEWVEATRRDDSDWREAVREKAPPAAPAARARPARPARAAAQEERKGFRYELHVAAFRSRAQADRLKRQVAAQGYRVSVARLQTRRPLFRVVVVGFPTRASAREAARVLGKAHRVDPQIVAVRA